MLPLHFVKYVVPTSSICRQAKCTAACQYSIDLLRHLSQLLREQCKATDEEACTSQVDALTLDYQQLLARKQAKEREEREARSDTLSTKCTILNDSWLITNLTKQLCFRYK